MMKWSVTFDRLPITATIGGVVYDVAFGYRTMMAAEIEMFRQDISDEQKMLNALNLRSKYPAGSGCCGRLYAVVPSRRRTSAERWRFQTSDGAAGILLFKGCPADLCGIPAAVRHQSQADAERLPALVGVPGDV